MAKQRTTELDAGDPADDDTHAFRSAVRDVKPLAHTPPPAGLARKTPRPRRRKAAALHESLDDVMPLIDPPSPVDADGHGAGPSISGGEALTFQRAGVQNQVLRRLRRGLFPIEDELDLHGLTQAVARDQLARFLTLNRDAGRRCVRIIHGKGYRSGARGPILKIAVDLCCGGIWT